MLPKNDIADRGAVRMSEGPNIVLIMCDSMDGRVMGCMDHPAMAHATPNMDRLAEEGVLFSNTYSNSPLCVPSRASMWSGKYVHHCEAWNNFKGLEEDTPTFQTRLEDAGYIAKTFGRTDYLSGRHTIRARVSAWTRSANLMRPNFRMEAPEILSDRRERVHNRDWDSVEKCIEWMRYASSPKSPFMIHLGIGAPHPPFVTSGKYLEIIDDGGVEIPPADESRHPALIYQRTIKNWMHGFSGEMIKKTRKIYFAMIAEVDGMVGKVMDHLKESGLDKSTFVIFTSDHGELAMEHRQFYKQSLYEPSVRVPLIVAGPGIQRGKQVKDLVSLIDIYPTLMSLSQASCPEGLNGQSLMPLLKGEKDNRPDIVFSELHADSLNTGAFMLRRGKWKYVTYVGMEPQLFNLEEDPWEIDNLATSRKEEVKKMDALIRKIVDYEKVDAKVKEYDKTSFREWRQKQKEVGTYEDVMARIFSGWDHLADDEVTPWTDADEDKIKAWLGEN